MPDKNKKNIVKNMEKNKNNFFFLVIFEFLLFLDIFHTSKFARRDSRRWGRSKLGRFALPTSSPLVRKHSCLSLGLLPSGPDPVHPKQEPFGAETHCSARQTYPADQNPPSGFRPRLEPICGDREGLAPRPIPPHKIVSVENLNK